MVTSELIFKMKINREASNFALYSLGKLVSMFGSSVYTFAIGLYVLRITGSGLSFAATMVLGLVPAILINPFAGVMADRFDKKKLVVGMDLANGVLLITVYFLSMHFGLKLAMIYFSTFLMNIFTAIFNVSFDAAIPNIISGKMLLNINSISKIIDSVSSILGPMIGGMVFAFIDIKSFVMINGLSFIFSGVSELFIDFKFNLMEEVKYEGNIEFIKDIKEGIKYMIERKDIVNLFAVFIILNFFLGFAISVPLPYIINNVLKLGPGYFGIIEGAFPVGMIAGAVVVKRIIERVSYNKLLSYVSFGMAVCMILTGLPVMLVNISPGILTFLVYYCLVMVLFGVMISFVDIPVIYMLQKMIPDDFRGRVLSIGVSVGKIILPLALILSGALLSLMPSYIIPIAGGIIYLILNFMLIKKR